MSSGVRTQLAGLVGAGLIVLLLVFAPALLADLPSSVLAAIVIAASLSLVEVAGVVRLYRMRRSEFVLSIACLAAVALVGVVAGIFISVGIAIVAFLWRAWRPYSAILGRLPGVKGYHDTSRHPEADLVPGLVLFRWDAPLFFANAEMFRDAVEDAIESSPTPVRRVVIAAEPVTDVDTTAADVLSELHRRARGRGHRTRDRRAEGPGQRSPAPLRPVRPDRRVAFLPDSRRSGERLRRRDRRAVGRLAGSRRAVTVQPPGTSCRCGSCTMTRSPPSARGVRVMVPWCAWVMLLTIARPRPTPAWPSRIRPEPR